MKFRQYMQRLHLNPIWTGLFGNLKRLGEGANVPSKLSHFKSDYDKTWCGYTMGRNLYKLTKNLTYQDFTLYSDCTIICDVTNINGIIFLETM